MPGSAGATEKPQWPMISVVTPWRTLLSALGLIGKVKSEWVLMSMKPGATARPAASMVFAAARVDARADRGDAAVCDREIAGGAGRAAAVEQKPAADHDVMHRDAPRLNARIVPVIRTSRERGCRNQCSGFDRPNLRRSLVMPISACRTG